MYTIKINNEIELNTLADTISTICNPFELDLNMMIPINSGFIPTIQSLYCKSITKLNLSNNMIHNSNMIELNKVLKSNRMLTHLYLSNTHSGEIPFGLNIILTDWLKNNKSLVYLDLSSNYIDDTMIDVLSDTIKFNNTLRSIDLSNNSITDRGALKLYQSIKYSNITELKLVNNHINHKTYKMLIIQICKNNLYNNKRLYDIKMTCLLCSYKVQSCYLPNELWDHIFSFM